MTSQDNLVVVQQTHVLNVMYEKTRQPLSLSGCVVETRIDEFYGPYSIYDSEGRLLGRSENGVISWRKNDLQTEAAHVWYESVAVYDDLFKLIANYVNDPGMCFSRINGLQIEFDSAPDLADDPNRRFDHIILLFTTNTLWDVNEKKTKV